MSFHVISKSEFFCIMTTKTVFSKYYLLFKILINKFSSKVFFYFIHFDHPLLELSVSNFIFNPPVVFINFYLWKWHVLIKIILRKFTNWRHEKHIFHRTWLNLTQFTQFYQILSKTIICDANYFLIPRPVYKLKVELFDLFLNKMLYFMKLDGDGW